MIWQKIDGSQAQEVDLDHAEFVRLANAGAFEYGFDRGLARQICVFVDYADLWDGISVSSALRLQRTILVVLHRLSLISPFAAHVVLFYLEGWRIGLLGFFIYQAWSTSKNYIIFFPATFWILLLLFFGISQLSEKYQTMKDVGSLILVGALLMRFVVILSSKLLQNAVISSKQIYNKTKDALVIRG